MRNSKCKDNKLQFFAHADTHLYTHSLIPQGGTDDMIQASSCPSETSVCHILETHCVQRRQGCKYITRVSISSEHTHLA